MEGILALSLMQSGISRYWLCQIFGWGTFASVSVFFAVTFDRFSKLFYTRLGIFIVLGIIFTHIMRWVIHETDLLLKTLNRQIIGFVLLTFITAVVVALMELLVNDLTHLEGEKSGYTFFGKLLLSSFNAFIYLFIWS
ncbi:MAG: hypothetical protein ABIR18_02805, partial [Chitinophagaceae bacterium]